MRPTRDLGTTKKRAAGEAPKHHTKKLKTSISVAGLFAKKTRVVREGLQSTDGYSRKRIRVEDELTAKAKRHPIYIDVKGTEGRAYIGRRVTYYAEQMRYWSTIKMTPPLQLRSSTPHTTSSLRGWK
jgi:hypothetical protein